MVWKGFQMNVNKKPLVGFILFSIILTLVVPYLVRYTAWYIERSIPSFSRLDLSLTLLVPLYMLLSFPLVYLLLKAFRIHLYIFENKRTVIVSYVLIYFGSIILWAAANLLIEGLQAFSLWDLIFAHHMVVMPGLLTLMPILFVMQEKRFANICFFSACLLASFPFAWIFLWPMLVIYYPIMRMFTSYLRRISSEAHVK